MSRRFAKHSATVGEQALFGNKSTSVRGIYDNQFGLFGRLDFWGVIGESV